MNGLEITILAVLIVASFSLITSGLWLAFGAAPAMIVLGVLLFGWAVAFQKSADERGKKR